MFLALLATELIWAVVSFQPTNTTFKSPYPAHSGSGLRCLWVRVVVLHVERRRTDALTRGRDGRCHEGTEAGIRAVRIVEVASHRQRHGAGRIDVPWSRTTSFQSLFGEITPAVRDPMRAEWATADPRMRSTLTCTKGQGKDLHYAFSSENTSTEFNTCG